MKTRLYEFIAGIESSTQPDAGTPTDPNDLITLSYVSGSLGSEKQEPLTGTINGSNTAFTVSETPLSDDTFKLFRSGILLRLGTQYTRSGITITMVVPPVVGQNLDAVYRY